GADAGRQLGDDGRGAVAGGADGDAEVLQVAGRGGRDDHLAGGDVPGQLHAGSDDGGRQLRQGEGALDLDGHRHSFRGAGHRDRQDRAQDERNAGDYAAGRGRHGDGGGGAVRVFHVCSPRAQGPKARRSGRKPPRSLRSATEVTTALVAGARVRRRRGAARVLVEAAVIDGLCAEHVAALHLQAIDL